MRTTNFTFKAKWVKAISLLPADYQAPATNAIIMYAYFGTLPEDKFILAFITLIIDEIDSETLRRDRIAKKRTEADAAPVEQGNEPPVAAPDEQRVREVMNRIVSTKDYYRTFFINIIKSTRNRAEANEQLKMLIHKYISEHPEITDVENISRAVADMMEKKIGTA